MNRVEHKLGFDRLREMIVSRCSTQWARDLALEQSFSMDAVEVRRRLELSDEMLQIRMLESSWPELQYADCIPFLLPLKAEYTHIDLIDLQQLRISLDTLRKLLAFFAACKEGKYPRLRALSAGVLSFPEVLRRIEAILDKYGQVKDNASAELQEIRHEIRAKEGSISRKAEQILKAAQAEGVADPDSTVSVRDGKVLIPVSASNKRKVPGLIYDESASGKTSYIEPFEIIQMGNLLRELHAAEQREILRILLAFTEFLRPYIDDIVASQKYVCYMDFIWAKTDVAASFEGGMPIISTEGELILRQARHPLLEQALRKEGRKIVPLDITIGPQRRILLISGPNAGGKSVCLKTVGLLQYMFQWGMLIPASRISELPILGSFFVDIGDDQSLENDLSTYSSHLTNMREVVEKADSESLVLIDEFGSGTEPAAGGAIAEAILAQMEQRRCWGVITTHYSNLKFYANNSTGVANGAMEFDVQNIKPLFRLEQGLPGSSFAFELARKIGLPEALVASAEERAGSDFVNIERNLRKIARNKRVLEERLTRIKATDRTLESITEKYEKELSEVKALKKSIIDQARQEARDILEGANRQIENTIREIRQSQAEKERTKAARKELEDFQKSVETRVQSAMDEQIERKMQQILARKERAAQRRQEREKRGREEQKAGAVASKAEQAAPVIAEGAYVRIKDSDMAGQITRINGKKITVSVGDILTTTTAERLEAISSSAYKSALKPIPTTRRSVDTSALTDRRLNFSPSMDIRGMRLEEAIPVVMHFLDDAMMLGMGQVSILHGKGNGVLKEEIRKYLKITPGVKSFADEHVERGGSGITIVTLD